MGNFQQLGSSQDLDGSSLASAASIPEGTYVGDARHKDGSLMAVVFQVRTYEMFSVLVSPTELYAYVRESSRILVVNGFQNLKVRDHWFVYWSNFLLEVGEGEIPWVFPLKYDQAVAVYVLIMLKLSEATGQARVSEWVKLLSTTSMKSDHNLKQVPSTSLKFHYILMT